MTRQELADLIGVSRNTLNTWEKDKPELVRLINLGLQTDVQITETRKLLEKLEKIEKKASSGKFELKQRNKMSVWCPKCQTLKNNKLKCDSCGFIEEDKSKSYKIPKPKQVRIINQAGLEKETITLNKNSIFIIATIIIAIGISYLAYNKYEENRQMSKLSKIMFGTDDADVILDNLDKQNKQSQKMIRQSQKQMEETLKQQQELLGNMFKK